MLQEEQGQPRYAEERHRRIVELARGGGRVEVAALASAFGVSPETVRRDLASLERRGVLRRTHGGAVPVERLWFEPEVAERLVTMPEEKARIARAALRFVPSEGVILLDAGTTTGALAELLPGERDLTVVTNGLPIASALAANSSITVYLAGGRVRGRTLAAVDDFAARFIEDLAPEVTFIGTNGVIAGRGLMTPDPAEATVKRAMIRSGRRVILLADHTKFGREHFVRFAEIGDIDAIVTDSGLGDSAAHELEAAGVEVVRV